MGRWMDRRSFMKAAGAGVAAAAFAARGARAAEGTGAKPSIVYILADDLGYGDVGCLNPESKIPTPNIDRLARGGMRFTDAHSGSAVCTPTRYGILTGRYCWRSRLKNSVLEGWSPALVDERVLTPGGGELAFDSVEPSRSTNITAAATAAAAGGPHNTPPAPPPRRRLMFFSSN